MMSGVLLSIAVAAELPPTPTKDDGKQPIAIICGRTIGIADLMVPAATPDSATRTEIASRMARLQMGFSDLSMLLLVECAGENLNIIVADDELKRALPPLLEDESQYRASWEPMLAVPRAAGRVLNGEAESRVYAEDLAKWRSQGITPEFFHNALQMFNTPERVRQFLAKDQAAGAREDLIRRTRAGLIIAEIRKRLAKRAAVEHRSLDELKSAFWSETIASAHAQILDPRFSLPDWKGIL